MAPQVLKPIIEDANHVVSSHNSGRFQLLHNTGDFQRVTITVEQAIGHYNVEHHLGEVFLSDVAYLPTDANLIRPKRRRFFDCNFRNIRRVDVGSVSCKVCCILTFTTTYIVYFTPDKTPKFFVKVNN